MGDKIKMSEDWRFKERAELIEVEELVKSFDPVDELWDLNRSMVAEGKILNAVTQEMSREKIKTLSMDNRPPGGYAKVHWRMRSRTS